MKVNMTPNPLDVVTIHASQGDTEARQWEFELHNNGDAIDSSSISDQLVFKAYEGGTEQILPENTSTPTTSPFKGDIKYPQGLLSDQEFLYRESPTEEDGLAKITDIKGNTLVWNQLVPSLSAMSAQKGTISVADNVATVTSSSSTNYMGVSKAGSTIILPKSEHRYLMTVEVNSSKALPSCNLWYGNELTYIQIDIPANTWTKVSTIVSSYGEPTGQYVQLRGYSSFEQGDTLQVRNWNYFDLTAMGLDTINTIEEFISLFPLPYYAYNQGTLLSFNGTGLKTTGKNILVNSGFVRGVLGWNNSPSDSNIVTNNAFLTSPFIPIPQGVSQITLSAIKGSIVRYWEADSNFNGLYFDGNKPNEGQTITRTLSAGCRYIRISIGKDGLSILPSYYGTVVYGQIEFGNQASNYEPYTESTTSLPISTYFPTGMKSAGNVYDELTPAKATTKISTVDLGSLTWERYLPNTYDNLFFTDGIASLVKTVPSNQVTNLKSVLYEPQAVGGGQWNGMKMGVNNVGRLYINNPSYTDAAAFKSAMSGVMLYYELATPTETLITTASLVTENAEIPLSNNDGVLIGKCTEQLSENPGFIDAKIKLSDSDGECYSNKIQLHVERSPQ